jgi:tRNA pseudouridine55 synthase
VTERVGRTPDGPRQATASSPTPGGVLVIDKPAGPTSFDVVARVRRLLHADKAGHTGTLDPLATGVLVVCLGDAVKLQQFLCEGDKEYRATIAFGAATTTEDGAGEIVARGDPSGLEPDSIRHVLTRFVGDIEQVPPMYSAVRVNGRRLHEAARAGEEVQRSARIVRVHSLELLRAEHVAGDFRVEVAVRCGKGTYVRTLAVDLGRAVGVPAHLAALVRTQAGPFRLDEAITLDEAERLASSDRAALLRRVLPLEGALRGWPLVHLPVLEARDLVHGRAVTRDGVPSGLCGALDPAGRLVAVCEGRVGVLQPVRVLRSSR